MLTDTVRAPLMAEAVELAMHSIGTAVDALPKPVGSGFTQRATPILADLRKLETVAANAARNARGTPSVVLALSAVRRRYNELMLRAASLRPAPWAAALRRAPPCRTEHRRGRQRRRRLDGSRSRDAESERPVPPDAAAAMKRSSRSWR